MTTASTAGEFAIEKFAIRMLLRAVAGVLLIAAAAYPVDWAIWRVRVAASGGMGQVSVSLFTVGELKGGREDYYPNGTSMTPCSESLYPQGGNSACWWLQRHHEVIQRY
jgi:hypothetical protein